MDRRFDSKACLARDVRANFFRIASGGACRQWTPYRHFQSRPTFQRELQHGKHAISFRRAGRL
jgi:hypothetical protein